MKVNRTALVGASCALALAACSDGADKSQRDPKGPVPALIPQLAAVQIEDGSQTVLQNLSPEQVRSIAQSGKARLIDVRTAEEVAQGMILGADHIAMDAFDPADVMAPGDDRAIILYCRSGRRSEIVGDQLAAYGDRPVAHMAGGILAWERAGYPITQP